MSPNRAPALRLPLVVLVALTLVTVACGDDQTTAQRAEASTTVTGVDELAPVPPEPSAGCADPEPVEAESVETITVDGAEWQYQRHVPAAHDGVEPVPMVVDFHGYSEGAGVHAVHTALGPFGDEQGFVTITPQGQGPVPLWNLDEDAGDLTFVDQLLDAEEAALCVDLNRVYATGLSNGAFMTSAVACALEGRVAAVAPVAGIRDLEGCELDRPVPVVAFHGTEDRFISYDGGLGPSVGDLPSPDGSGRSLAEEGQLPEEAEIATGGSVPAQTAGWAARNGCDPEPTETAVADDVTLVEFTCPDDATTQLYRVDGGGHSWPGSDFSVTIESVVGPTTFSIDANELMWAFFEEHPRR